MGQESGLVASRSVYGVCRIMASLDEVTAEIKQVNLDLKALALDIAALEAQMIATAVKEEEMGLLHKEKERLRMREGQMRKKKEQLRETELLFEVRQLIVMYPGQWPGQGQGQAGVTPPQVRAWGRGCSGMHVLVFERWGHRGREAHMCGCFKL